MTSKPPKIIEISAKCSDLFYARLTDSDGKEIAEYDGYVPNFMPGEHWGDYVMLKIDIISGKIIDWTFPSPSKVLKEFKRGAK